MIGFIGLSGSSPKARGSATSVCGRNGNRHKVLMGDGAGVEVRRLCRVCKKSFVLAENHESACLYHPENYSGDSKRKGNWEVQGPPGEAEHFWWCCGETSKDHPGCTAAAHLTYDD